MTYDVNFANARKAQALSSNDPCGTCANDHCNNDQANAIGEAVGAYRGHGIGGDAIVTKGYAAYRWVSM